MKWIKLMLSLLFLMLNGNAIPQKYYGEEHVKNQSLFMKEVVMNLRERLAEFERQKLELRETILFGSYDVILALKEHPIILSIEEKLRRFASQRLNTKECEKIFGKKLKWVLTYFATNLTNVMRSGLHQIDKKTRDSLAILSKMELALEHIIKEQLDFCRKHYNKCKIHKDDHLFSEGVSLAAINNDCRNVFHYIRNPYNPIIRQKIAIPINNCLSRIPRPKFVVKYNYS